jgi:hypothetical protein
MALKPGSGSGKAGQSFQAGRVKVARWYYDFATDGGAVSTITLRGDEIPTNCVVIDARIDITTALTSGGAPTVRLDLEGSADLRAAAALGTAPVLNAIDVLALLNSVKTTASRDVSMVIATAALTAGAFSVIVTYVEVTSDV